MPARKALLHLACLLNGHYRTATNGAGRGAFRFAPVFVLTAFNGHEKDAIIV